MSERTKQKLEQENRLKENISKIKNKLIVISGKGGVGKTTIAVNLSYSLAIKGYRVGILDVDIHGPNIAKMLGIEGERLIGSELGIEPVKVLPNLKAVSLALLGEGQDKPVIWRGPLKMGVIKQLLSDVNWGELDYLIIDSPPGTGDEPLSVCQLISDINPVRDTKNTIPKNKISNGVNGAIVVTTPQDVAILDSRKSILFAKELKVPVIGVIENMSGFICPHCQKEIDLFGTGGGEKSAYDLGVPFLGKVPIEPEMVKFGDSGRPFLSASKVSLAATVMYNIVNKITEFLTRNES